MCYLLLNYDSIIINIQQKMEKTNMIKAMAHANNNIANRLTENQMDNVDLIEQQNDKREASLKEPLIHTIIAPRAAAEQGPLKKKQKVCIFL